MISKSNMSARLMLILHLVAFTLVVSAAPAMAQPGVLDRSFSDDGYVDIPGSAARIDVRIQTGNLIIVGDSRFRIIRLHTNGGRDTSFGSGGTAQAEFNKFEEATDMAIDSKGAHPPCRHSGTKKPSPSPPRRCAVPAGRATRP